MQIAFSCTIYNIIYLHYIISFLLHSLSNPSNILGKRGGKSLKKIYYKYSNSLKIVFSFGDFRGKSFRKIYYKYSSSLEIFFRSETAENRKAAQIYTECFKKTFKKRADFPG